MLLQGNATTHEGFKTGREVSDKWDYWEKLNPKIRLAMQNHPINFGIYSTWKLQKEKGVKHVLQQLNTRALELTVCDVEPLGINHRWVVKAETM